MDISKINITQYTMDSKRKQRSGNDVHYFSLV